MEGFAKGKENKKHTERPSSNSSPSGWRHEQPFHTCRKEEKCHHQSSPTKTYRCFLLWKLAPSQPSVELIVALMAYTLLCHSPSECPSLLLFSNEDTIVVIRSVVIRFTNAAVFSCNAHFRCPNVSSAGIHAPAIRSTTTVSSVANIFRQRCEDFIEEAERSLRLLQQCILLQNSVKLNGKAKGS